MGKLLVMYEVSPKSIFALRMLSETVHGHYHSWLTWYRKDMMPGGSPGDRGMSTTPEMRLPPPASVFDDLVAQGLVVREERAPRADGPALSRWITRVALTPQGVALAKKLGDESYDEPVKVHPATLAAHMPDDKLDGSGR